MLHECGAVARFNWDRKKAEGVRCDMADHRVDPCKPLGIGMFNRPAPKAKRLKGRLKPPELGSAETAG